jgi:formamidopyrimidine-DNA glycosylase
MNQVFDPVANIETNVQAPAVASESSMVSTSAALSVDSHEVCPKCGTPTVQSKLADGRAVMFCSGCAVTLPIPLED